MQITSMEDQVFNASRAVPVPYVVEAYRGSKIVAWWGNIDNQLTDSIQKYDADKNFADATKLRQFQRTWRDSELTGSVNREDVVTLKAAATQLAVDNWKMSAYFSALSSSLRELLASLEELPPAGEELGDETVGDGPSSDYGSQAEPEMTGGPGNGEPSAAQTSGPVSRA